jgi:hypothetical protein
MKFTFSVEVEIHHVSGKFASRVEISEQLALEIKEADPGFVLTDDGSEYNVDAWEVSPEQSS